MDYLSEKGKGDYLEIQGGVMPTQLHTKSLKADTHIEWTECVAPLHLDAKQAHATNYLLAVASAGQMIKRDIPAATLVDRDVFLSSHADTPISDVLARGSGWGGAHERLTGKRISPGLVFDTPLQDEGRPWQNLLTQGTFSKNDLNQDPRSFSISPRWIAALRRSVETHGATWLHHLHLGVAQLENGEYEAARTSFDASLRLKHNAHAERCLALLAERDGKIDAANSAYMRAWALCQKDAPLAIEICGFLRRHARKAEGEYFLAALPPHIAKHERLQLERARFALDRGEYTFVRNLLKSGEFCTIREGEQSLSDLWFASFLQEEAARMKRELTTVEKQTVRDKNPPPRTIDFRMK